MMDVDERSFDIEFEVRPGVVLDESNKLRDLSDEAYASGDLAAGDYYADLSALLLDRFLRLGGSL